MFPRSVDSARPAKLRDRGSSLAPLVPIYFALLVAAAIFRSLATSPAGPATLPRSLDSARAANARHVGRIVRLFGFMGRFSARSVITDGAREASKIPRLRPRGKRTGSRIHRSLVWGHCLQDPFPSCLVCCRLWRTRGTSGLETTRPRCTGLVRGPRAHWTMPKVSPPTHATKQTASRTPSRGGNGFGLVCNSTATASFPAASTLRTAPGPTSSRPPRSLRLPSPKSPHASTPLRAERDRRGRFQGARTKLRRRASGERRRPRRAGWRPVGDRRGQTGAAMATS